MPIHELGYRRWSGAVRTRWLRWWCIARTGIVLALRTKLTRRLSLVAILPVFYFGPVFFGIGLVTDPEREEISRFWSRMVRGVIENDRLVDELRENPALLRAPLWNDFFHLLQSHVQVIMAIVITATVAPALIARDLRSKAYLIYFSKPITRTDYLLGKVGVIAAYLAWFTLVPSLLIYALSIVFAPSADALAQTAPVIPSIVAAALITIVPITAISLFLSSLTRDERIATFAWAALFLGGEFAYMTLDNVPGFEDQGWVTLLSLRESIRSAIAGVFSEPILGITVGRHPELALGWLGLLTAVCSFGLWRRISAPLRI